MFTFKPQLQRVLLLPDIFNDIFCISNPNNVKLCSALTRARRKTSVKFEIHRTSCLRDFQLTDRHTDIL